MLWPCCVCGRLLTVLCRGRAVTVLGQGLLGRDLGRRSGRARRDVSYAMPGRRGMGGGSNFRNSSVQIDVADTRAFPADLALKSDPPYDRNFDVVSDHFARIFGSSVPPHARAVWYTLRTSSAHF